MKARWAIKILSFSFLIGLFGVSSSQAMMSSRTNDPTDVTVRTACVEDLLRGGITEVGSLNLGLLWQELSNVHVEPFKVDSVFREWDQIVLHKSLITLGYDDRDYQISTGLCWLSRKSFLTKKTNQFKDTTYKVREHSEEPAFAALRRPRVATSFAQNPVGHKVADLKLQLLLHNFTIETIKGAKAHPDRSRAEVEALIMQSKFRTSTNLKALNEITVDSNGVFVLPDEMILLSEQGSLEAVLYKKIIQTESVKAAKTKYTVDQLILSETRSQCIKQNVANGVDRVGDVDLHKLLQEVETVSVTFDDEIERGSGGLRRSGVNYPGTGKVILQTPKTVELNYDWKVILLHESLGALGYDDENYGLSTALCWGSSQNKDIKYLEAVEKSFTNIKRIFEPRLYPTYKWTKGFDGKLKLESGGGATSTGGGGDIYSSTIKFNMLGWNLAFEEMERTGGIKAAHPGLTSEEIEKGILEMRLELFNDNPDVQEIQTTRDKDGTVIYWVPKSQKLRNSAGVLENVDLLLYLKLRGDLALAKKGVR